MLTIADKARVRRHLGYPQVTAAQTFAVGGIPAPMELNFMLEGAMDKAALESEPYLRTLLDRMDGIEAQMISDQGNLAASAVGNIRVNLDEFKMLIQQYAFWQGALSNLLAVPANPFDKRWAGAGINVPVA